ncbi:putative 1-phosphatidylinositol-4,5-bisphosphate phosphodiesterase 1 [Triangularia verruculosa]|uniref:Phosphoinositide phospholipase C n=1 Tax=Triangularia verruculosa TaxID=2587418 RepID=A0AAN6XMV2_9PEZI|nr:putative 1-phosphatidylinositol-4,5-bisphosphate phosphodiesterase 1 [Triangularia verruculosa]
MSVSADSPRPVLPSTSSPMLPDLLQTKRSSRPSQVRTDLVPPSHAQLVVIPPSAVSNSSASTLWPSSQHGSPTQSTEAVTSLTTPSSLQGSPDSLESGQEKGLEMVTPFQLPEAIVGKQPDQTTVALSRRTSNTSLGGSALKSPLGSTTAMAEATKSMSLIRRTSSSLRNRANGLFPRRGSSTHPRSRDGSVGPGVMRRRGSMSNPSTPYDNISPFETDSDDDAVLTGTDEVFGGDGALRESCFPTSTPLAASFGSVPISLRQGTPLTKIANKKNSRKRIVLTLDPDSAKIWWDRTKASKCVYVDDIKEIRTAGDIGQYLLDAKVEEKDRPRFFSLMYAVPGKPNTTKWLHLIADNDKTFNDWTRTLGEFSRYRQDFAASLMAFNDDAVRVYWDREMEKRFGAVRSKEVEQIEFTDVEQVCRNLHIHASTDALRRIFDAIKAKRLSYSQGLGSGLNFDEFLEFVRMMKTREDVRRVYLEHTADPEAGMTKHEFMQFLRLVQCENVDEDLATWEATFGHFARRGKAKDADFPAEADLFMSKSAFVSYLSSPSNAVIPKAPQKYDLDRPINEYYISSSHNTYLLGRQVAGTSSVEGYISALMGGCRCVEVDCWDGADDQPVVSHGHTMTTRISFVEVIKTINKYAFVTSRFPLWISLEVRCSQATQVNMAKIMMEIFGDKLVQKPLEQYTDRLPSPSDLMERILIKVKKPQQPDPAERTGRRRGNSMPSPFQRPLPDSGPAPASPLLSPTAMARTNRINTITEGKVHETPSSSPSECDSESEKDSARRVVNSKISPVLGALGVYCVGIQFDGFDTPEAKSFNHIFSFKEKTFAEKNQPGPSKRALYRHNMRHLMRVYPNGGRITSSNFDPLIYWKRGVQMAALNWQTFDLGMQLNQAMFAGGTDQSGYVLKPLEGRQIQVMPNLTAVDCVGKRPRKRVSFDIDVISAQQLMRPDNLGDKRTLDPYVEVEVFLADDKRNKNNAVSNVTVEESKRTYRSKFVRDNGFNPEFNMSCSFDLTTKYPDLIFVRFKVKQAEPKGYSDKSPPLATYTAKLSNLKQGYRTIPLLNSTGEQFLFSTLFVKIRKGPVEVFMADYQEETPKNGNRLKNIGRNVFNQSNTSPKSSMDSGRS